MWEAGSLEAMIQGVCQRMSAARTASWTFWRLSSTRGHEQDPDMIHWYRGPFDPTGLDEERARSVWGTWSGGVAALWSATGAVRGMGINERGGSIGRADRRGRFVAESPRKTLYLSHWR